MLTFSTTTRGETTHVVHLQGMLSAVTYQGLENELQRLVAEGAKLVVLDLKNLEFIASVGIRVLLKTLKDLRAQGGDLRTMSVKPTIQSVFDLVALFPADDSFRDGADLDRHLAARKGL